MGKNPFDGARCIAGVIGGSERIVMKEQAWLISLKKRPVAVK